MMEHEQSRFPVEPFQIVIEHNLILGDVEGQKSEEVDHFVFLHRVYKQVAGSPH